MKITRAALAAATALGALAVPGVAHAQYGSQPRQEVPTGPQSSPAPAQPAQPQRQYDLSRAERTALQPVILAVHAANWAAATAGLPAAVEAARSPHARYLVGQIRLQIGLGTNNTQLQSQGIDEMIASGGALPNEMRPLLENQLQFATQAGDTAKAAAAQAQLDRINPPDPNDPTRLLQQARQRATTDPAGAIGLYQQAIQQQQTAGQPIPAEWRQQVAGIAYRARMPEAVRYMRELLVVSPSPTTWHDALVIYADIGGANPALKLDIYRLMRAAGAMTSERDFIELAEAANSARAFGEVKAVLEDGLARNLITANAAYARERLRVVNPRVAGDRASLAGERAAAIAGSDGTLVLRLADAYFGYGDYGPAAELYRAALSKGGDANLLNTRLGASLALAGNRAEAETAFRAVTGPRAELAQFWLLWLSTRR